MKNNFLQILAKILISVISTLIVKYVYLHLEPIDIMGITVIDYIKIIIGSSIIYSIVFIWFDLIISNLECYSPNILKYIRFFRKTNRMYMFEPDNNPSLDSQENPTGNKRKREEEESDRTRNKNIKLWEESEANAFIDSETFLYPDHSVLKKNPFRTPTINPYTIPYTKHFLNPNYYNAKTGLYEYNNVTLNICETGLVVDQRTRFASDFWSGISYNPNTKLLYDTLNKQFSDLLPSENPNCLKVVTREGKIIYYDRNGTTGRVIERMLNMHDEWLKTQYTEDAGRLLNYIDYQGNGFKITKGLYEVSDPTNVLTAYEPGQDTRPFSKNAANALEDFYYRNVNASRPALWNKNYNPFSSNVRTWTQRAHEIRTGKKLTHVTQILIHRIRLY